MRVLGIDPGSERTGYGCVESSGSRHRMIASGVVRVTAGAPLADRLLQIHQGLTALLREHQPACVAIESIFHARHARSALVLGHARGVAMLTAAEVGVPIHEYAPTAIKRAVVGFGRADKAQVQHMVSLLLGLDAVPTPFDASDALAAAICHLHAVPSTAMAAVLPPAGSQRRTRSAASWRHFRPER